MTAKKTIGCTPNFTFVKSGKTVQFKDKTNGAKYWHWDFNGDGKPDSYKQNPKALFPKPGKYKVCLTTSCGGTSGWKSVCKVVTV
jgi:PKD repeat protein